VKSSKIISQRRIPNDKHDINHHHSNHLSDNCHAVLDWEEIKMSNEDYQKLMGNIQNDRDCEHCAHCKPSENGIMGCESWECEFKPKGDES
jgi:hypothetical protein